MSLMTEIASSLPTPPALTGAELKELWQKVVVRLHQKISEANLLTWFKNTAVLDLTAAGVLVIGAPNAFVQNSLARKFHGDIFREAKELMRSIRSIEIETDVSLSNAGDPRTFDIKSLITGTEKRLSTPKAVFSGESNGTYLLNPRYTLENFVVGENNRLAFAASKAVAANPGSAYNPLYVYGGVGLGKTHLLQAIGNAILKKSPRKKVLYVTSEEFMNDLVNAIQNRRTKHFKDRYRSIDVWIVDDIQFLANKVQTQVEFFHTFNTLFESGRQIVISSDRPPRELKTLEDRLISRFGMGMLVDVQSPDLETKLAILQKKCQERGALVPGNLLEIVASRTNGNIRELEGALIHIFAHLDMFGELPPVSKMNALLGVDKHQSSQESYRRKPIDYEDVVRVVSEQYNTTPADLIGQSRKQEVVTPRHVCMFILRKKLNFSYERIGEIFGGRNHTTVMHSFEKISNELLTDKSLVKVTNEVVHTLGL